jgi:hypothetical protein
MKLVPKVKYSLSPKICQISVLVCMKLKELRKEEEGGV